MGRSRLELDDILRNLMDGNKVYFQPPPTVTMDYPCIVYERSNMYSTYADDIPYNVTNRYLITVIDSDPESPFADKVAALPTAKFDRHYTVENLYHDILEIYF